jgi:hypothetical protein
LLPLLQGLDDVVEPDIVSFEDDGLLRPFANLTQNRDRLDVVLIDQFTIVEVASQNGFVSMERKLT